MSTVTLVAPAGTLKATGVKGDEYSVVSGRAAIQSYDVAGFIGLGWTTPPVDSVEVTGTRNDPESALAGLLTALAGLGIITDSTTQGGV